MTEIQNPKQFWSFGNCNLEFNVGMAKIVKDIDKLAFIVENLKAKGKKIVFVNGCFDILHVGHIRYLKGAKALGDVLIAALNSDTSVRALKGSGRPLTPEGERLEILSAIRYVDYVTLFSETRVDKLLLKLKPHIHAKGTDYAVETVPERQTVLSYGGEIAIVGDPKDHSSSKMVKNQEHCDRGTLQRAPTRKRS